jgi:NADPH:quinone reductase-like Zn-dependent oxidoreductase
VLHNFHIKNPAALLHVPPYAGVNVVFDPVGGSALFESLKCVAWGAHYLVIGFAAGDIPKVSVAAFGVGVWHAMAYRVSMCMHCVSVAEAKE